MGLAANPTADAGLAVTAAQRALKALEAAGCVVTHLSGVSWSETLDAAMRARDDLDALVVVGGDGMVHLGAQVCAQQSLPLGIVAAGSGNDFASIAGLPVREPERSVHTILRGLGRPRTIDLGRVDLSDGSVRWFAGVLSAGIDAAIAERGRRMQFPRGESKYKVAVARELPGHKPYGVRVHARVTSGGDAQYDGAWTLIAVSNSGLLGGGIPMSPHSDISDGALELVRAEPISRAGVVRIFPRLMRGTHIADPRVHITQVDRVSLAHSDAGAMAPTASADGEPLGSLPLTVTCVPGALRLAGAVPAAGAVRH